MTYRLPSAQTFSRAASGRWADNGVTLPMEGPDAESWLRLTVLALRPRLLRDDMEFLEEAMRAYGQACVAEASKAGQRG